MTANLKVNLDTFVAFDYDAQQWVKGAPAVQLLRLQWEEQLAELCGPNGFAFLRFTHGDGADLATVVNSLRANLQALPAERFYARRDAVRPVMWLALTPFGYMWSTSRSIACALPSDEIADIVAAMAKHYGETVPGYSLETV